MELLDKTFIDKVLFDYISKTVQHDHSYINDIDYDENYNYDCEGCEQDTETCDSTYGYLCYIMTPYVQILNKQKSIEDINIWMSNTLSSAIVDFITSKIDVEGIKEIENIRKLVIAKLLEHIFKTTDLVCENHEFGPWDICESLKSTGIPFNLPDTTLPITINGGDTHEITFDHVLGVLTFYHLMRKQCVLSICGHNMPAYGFLVQHMMYSRDYTRYNYTVNIGGNKCRFEHDNFYKGILLAIQILNLNQTDYITEEPIFVTSEMKAEAELQYMRLPTLDDIKGICK